MAYDFYSEIGTTEEDYRREFVQPRQIALGVAFFVFLMIASALSS